jgi:DNA topoisomerase-3
MTFILAEKPSVAESFAAALGVKKTGGYYQDDAWTITNCIGHLLTLYDAQDYDPKFKKWVIADLPVIPDQFLHKPSESTEKQLALVKQLLSRGYDRYVIATDAGREGELIARLVLRHSGISDFSRVYRFWTSSALTKEVVLDCLQKLRPAADYEYLYKAGLYRQLSDWLIGINFSRFFSVRLGSRFIFGRVQTPVLNLIVEREKDIKSFKKSFFYRLRITSLCNGAEFYSYLLDADKNINFEDRQIPESLKSAVNGPSTVTDVTIEKKTRFPPRLLDLTELQKTANVKFGYTAKKTLDLAQALYEKHKCLSYPRTASRYLSRTNRDLFIQCLDKLEIPHGEIDPQNKNIFNDEAMEKNKEDHHALLLLGPLPQTAAPDERNIYDIVMRNMTAVVMEPYVFEQVRVFHAADSLSFVSNGITVIAAGWKSPETADEEEEGEDEEKAQTLPDLKKGGSITLKDPLVTEHERKPPKSFSESALLAAMKKYDLGTVATRDSIIEGLVKNEYVFRKGKNLLPAEKAFFFIGSIKKLDNGDLVKYLDVNTTKEWELMLENEPDKFFIDIKNFLVNTVNAVKGSALDTFRNAIGKCPLCGGNVIGGKTNYYCSGYKESGCAFSVGKSICKAAVTEADIAALLSGKKTGLKSMESKAGKEFRAYLRLDKDGKIQFEFKETKPKEAKK